MTDTNQHGTPMPTYYANFVTSVLTADDLVMELRRFDRPHREIGPPAAGTYTVLLPPTPRDILNQEPIARVVMTFSAARALKDYLDATLPRIEEARKSGKPVQ